MKEMKEMIEKIKVMNLEECLSFRDIVVVSLSSLRFFVIDAINERLEVLHTPSAFAETGSIDDFDFGY